LWITQLSDSAFEAEAGPALELPLSVGAYAQGMHTLSACGPVTLIDVKRIDTSVSGLMLDLRRALRRFD
jgi:hypothetical protein